MIKEIFYFFFFIVSSWRWYRDYYVSLQVFRGKINGFDLDNICCISTTELGPISGRKIMKDHEFHVLTHIAEVFLAV